MPRLGFGHFMYQGALALTMLIVAVVRGEEQQYIEVSAKIELISYPVDANGDTVMPKSRSFSLNAIFGISSWRIDNNFIPHSKEAWYWDGTNVYHRLEFVSDSISLTNVKVSTGGIQANLWNFRSNVTVYVNPSLTGHPLGNIGVNIPWLAFCSGSYLRRTGRDIPLPTTEIRIDPFSLSYLDDIEVFDDELGLPKSVRLMASRARYEAFKDDERLLRYSSVESSKTASIYPIPENMLAFDYSVDAATNFGKWFLPAKFSYKSFKVGKEGKPILFVGGFGTIVSIRDAVKPESVFMKNSAQSIVDYRFRHQTKLVDGIVYSSTNLAELPSTNAAVLRANFDNVARRAGSATTTWTSLQRRRVVQVFIIVTIVSVALVFFNRKKSLPNQ